MDKENENRILWIDCAKALAIILVVVGHISSDTYVFKWIYSFHMAFFFFIGGYTLKPDKPAVDFIRGKCKTLLFPYLIGSIFWYAIYKGIYIGNNTIVGLANDIKNAEAAVIKGNYNDLLYFNSMLWFIPCFFVSECTLYWISKVIRNKKEIFLIVFFLTTATNLGLMPWIGTWHITESWSYLIWMALGYCTCNYIEKLTYRVSYKSLLGIAIAGFTVLSVFVENIGSIDKARCPLSPIGILSLIAFSAAICRAIKNKGLSKAGGGYFTDWKIDYVSLTDTHVFCG